MAGTLKDIARLAGVSIGTVSTVLNNSNSSARISENTRSRVLETVKRLNYKPNVSAKSLKMARSFTFGVLAGHIAGSFIPEILAGIENFFVDKELTMLLSTFRDEHEFSRKSLLLKERQVEGVIVIAGRRELDTLLSVTLPEVPLVMTGYAPNRQNCSSVQVESFSVGYQAARHLLEQGHRKIAFFSYHDEKRMEGYKSALAEWGIPFDESWVIDGGNEFKDGADMFRRLLARPNYPQAIIAHSDVLAVGVVNTAFKMGFSVPEDFSVIGIDGGPAAEMCRPPLTTIDQPRSEQGWIAGELLHKLISGGAPEDILLKPKLIIRESCGATKENR